MTIGDRIRARRQELGFSVDELATRLGKNRATVYRYETAILKIFLLEYWNLLHLRLEPAKPIL